MALILDLPDVDESDFCEWVPDYEDGGEDWDEPCYFDEIDEEWERSVDWDQFEEDKRQRIAESNEY